MQIQLFYLIFLACKLSSVNDSYEQDHNLHYFVLYMAWCGVGLIVDRLQAAKHWGTAFSYVLGKDESMNICTHFSEKLLDNLQAFRTLNRAGGHQIFNVT